VGYKRQLKREDLWEVDENEKVEANVDKLERLWNPKARA
jgi:hypothetical protein